LVSIPCRIYSSANINNNGTTVLSKFVTNDLFKLLSFFFFYFLFLGQFYTCVSHHNFKQKHIK